MTIDHIHAVMDSDLPERLRSLAIAIADRADKAGERIFASVSYWSWRTNQSERTVQNHLRELRQMGVIVVLKGGGGGRKLTTHYRFNMDALPERPTWQGPGMSKGAELAPFEDAWGISESSETVQLLSGKGATLTEKGASFADEGCKFCSETVQLVAPDQSGDQSDPDQPIATKEQPAPLASFFSESSAFADPSPENLKALRRFVDVAKHQGIPFVTLDDLFDGFDAVDRLNFSGAISPSLARQLRTIAWSVNVELFIRPALPDEPLNVFNDGDEANLGESELPPPKALSASFTGDAESKFGSTGAPQDESDRRNEIGA